MKAITLTMMVLILTVISCDSQRKSKKDSPEITGKYWKLKKLNGKDIAMVDNQEREIFFTLNAEENRINGFAGCNSMSREFTIEEGSRIRFKGMAVTMKACLDVEVNEAEFLKVFELADNFTVNNEELSLQAGERAPLAIFEAVYLK